MSLPEQTLTRSLRIWSLRAVLLWSLVLSSSLFWNVYSRYVVEVEGAALIQARTIVNKDLAFRRWVTGHGGVYVPITKETPPNPYLDSVRKVVVTQFGDSLTLMNPAYVMRQVTDEFARDFGIHGHLTSLNLTNPANAPDDWEHRTLERMSRGAGEIHETLDVSGKPYLRYMAPIAMEKGCVRCHADMNIPVGALRGGLSTRIPLEPIREAAMPGVRLLILTHGLTWALGLAGIILFYRRMRRQDRERLQEEERARGLILHQATHDDLTGLPNRRLMSDRIHLAMARADRSGYKVAVMFIDLDDFKTINDSLGHDQGDIILRQIAVRIQSCLRDEDTLARLGGDEFAVVMETPAIQEIKRVAQRIQDVFGAPLQVGHQEVFITPSIGISLYPDDGAEALALLRNADTALYRVKESGKNSIQFYTQDMNSRATERLFFESAIRKALDLEQFFLVYQPQYDTSTNMMIGVEALIRWEHPEMGVVSPMSFIPVAEESGLILPVGEWVIETVCAQIRQWKNEGLLLPRVSVNVSPRQFQKSKVGKMLKSYADAYGVEGYLLCVELTESALVDRSPETLEALRAIRETGAEISVDDFGTGYSSLSYLKHLPITELKIDKSFVDGLPDDKHDRAIVIAITAMSRAMGIAVLAEGVETQDQLDFLSAHGCDLIQGYLLSRPVSAAEITNKLKELSHVATLA